MYTDHKFLRNSVTYANSSVERNVLNTSQGRVKYNKLSWWYVLKTTWRYLCRKSWRCLEDILKTSSKRLEDALKTPWRGLEDVLTTSSKRLEDVLKTYGQEKYIGLDQDVLKTSSEDVFWRRRAKANIFVLIKTSWRCLQDVFWRRRRKTSSRRLQEVFIKTNVCWELSV